MLENCDALLNATAVYHQNHCCATRSALGKFSESTSAWPHDQLQTQEVRGSHRESALTQQPPPTLRVDDSGASENLAIWRIWRLSWHWLDKYSINYVALQVSGGERNTTGRQMDILFGIYTILHVLWQPRRVYLRLQMRDFLLAWCGTQ